MWALKKLWDLEIVQMLAKKMSKMLLGMLSKIFWDVDWNFDLDVDLKMLTKVLFKGEVLKEGWDEVNKATFMVKQENKVNKEE